jgi:hypothetical protein
MMDDSEGGLFNTAVRVSVANWSARAVAGGSAGSGPATANCAAPVFPPRSPLGRKSFCSPSPHATAPLGGQGAR